MDDDPGNLPYIIMGAAFIIITIAIPVIYILVNRRYTRAATMRLDPFLARLAVIAGAETPHPVTLYAIHGFFVMSSEYTPKAYLTRQNAEEVERLARQLRAFSFRWGAWGIFSHGGPFIPLIIWWNYHKALPTIASFRRSY